MGRRSVFLAALLVFLPGAAAPPPQAQLEALLAADARVAGVAHRVQRAGVRHCPRRGHVVGASLHHLGQYRPDLRPAARRLWPVGDAVAVSAVAPGSAAERAGLRPGDALLAIDGATLSTAGSATARVAAAASALHAGDGGPLRLDVRRGEQPLLVRITPEIACVSRVQLVPSKRARAAADGELVTLTTALLAFVRNDDELAFVLAHEIAHNALGHARRQGAARPDRRSRERAADRLALKMMGAAGYRIEAVVPFIERLYRGGPAGGLLSSLGHLGRRERVAAVRAEIGRVAP